MFKLTAFYPIALTILLQKKITRSITSNASGYFYLPVRPRLVIGTIDLHNGQLSG